MYRFRILSLAFALCLLTACGGGGGGGGGSAGADSGGTDYGSSTGRDLAGVTRAIPSTMGALEAI